MKTTRSARHAPKKRVKGKSLKKPKVLPYFIHPKGMVDEAAEVGEGTRVWAHAHVMKGAKVGSHCNIGECSFIETGAVLGNHVTIKNGVQIWDKVTCEDYVFCGPNATFTNDLRPRVAFPVPPEQFAKTVLKYGTSIGANATIVAGTTLGPHALVGAGTVVIRDVPAHALVVGNPARQIGWVCACGSNLDPSFACPACHKRFVKDGNGLRPEV